MTTIGNRSVNYNAVGLHPGHPEKVWVVVEQPRDEAHRLVFDPVSGTFQRSTVKSLLYVRGFSGVYGWIGGSGVPPEPHHDVLLFTRQFPSCGAILLGYVCGVFLRQDDDHKFVAVDEEIRQGMAVADLSALDVVHHDELLQLYPRVDEGEGWYGLDVAISHLLKQPLHD